jgi:hypothetical protein
MTITPVPRVVVGENAHSAAVLNRRADAILSGSGYAADGTDFAGFARQPGGVLSGIVYDNGGMVINAKHPDYGAVGDTRSVADGAITTATPNFTSASAAFTAADVGKTIIVLGAGVAGAALTTTIFAYVSPTAVTLTANASTTVSGATTLVGTDDTVAVNAILAKAGRMAVFPRGTGTYLVMANLAKPVCAGIVGEGEAVTILQAGPAVTKLLPLGSECTYHRGYQVLGNTTANAVGIVFGDAEAGAYRVDHVRVQGFNGAGAVGVRCKNALKSQFDRLFTWKNSTNLLIDGTGGIAGMPTTLEFNTLVCIDAGLAGGTLGVGCKIVTADTVTFNDPVFDSNVAEAVLVQPAAGGTVTGVVFRNPRFEDNRRGAGATTYQVVVDATAGGWCTARVAIRDGAWSAGAGDGAPAASLHITGVGAVGYLLDNPQVLDVAATVLIDTGAFGTVINWPVNLLNNRLSDTTGNTWMLSRGRVQFPSTANLSTNGYTLDDYDENTRFPFTPTIVLGTGSVTYTSRFGSYTKKGREVSAHGEIVIATVTTPSGTLTIGGFPYTSITGFKGAFAVLGTGLAATATHPMIGRIDAAAATARLFRFNGTGGYVDPGADLQAGSVISFSVTYDT